MAKAGLMGRQESCSDVSRGCQQDSPVPSEQQSLTVLGLSVEQCLCIIPERVCPEAFKVLLKSNQSKVLAGRGALQAWLF